MRKILHSSLFLLVALVCVPAVSQASTRQAYSVSTESQVLVLLNDIRHEHGLPTLTGSIALRDAALRLDQLDRGRAALLRDLKALSD